MDIQKEKLMLIEQLLQVQDDKVLSQVRELLKNAKSVIVGYDSAGTPVTQKDFIERIERAENEHKAGNFQTIDEVEKESESW